MHYLALFFTLILLWINLWGAAILCGIFVHNRWLSLAIAPWIWTTLLFSAETLGGLGQLRGLCICTTLLACVAIFVSADERFALNLPARFLPRLAQWRLDFSPRRFAPVFLVFVLIFGYAMAWRISFPLIDGSSEKIPDLAYISSYLPGNGVPARDAWLYPYPSVQYYSFQYYAAALLGRMLGLGPGLTYNVGFCTIVALTGFTFAGATTFVARTRRLRVALIAVFLFGGTGAAGIVHLFFKDATLWNGMRFIGSQKYDQAPIGLKMQAYADHYKRIEVPGEPFSYMVFLGDYHPPFSGFYLLALGVLAAGLWHKTGQKRFALILGATGSWVVLSNTWTFPLQAAAITVWCLWNRARWRELYLPVAIGAVAVWIACIGYLTPFALASQEYKTAFKMVASDEHTPALLWLIYLFPTIGITVLCIYSRCREGVWVGLSGCAALFVSEFVFVDDVYSGEFNRFNTTLKWWPWIAMIILLVAAPIVIERASRKWVRALGWLICLYPAVYALDLARHWWLAPKPDFGLIEGAQFINQDESSRYILARLKAEPRGTVIERPNKESYTNSGALPLFAGHHLWLGWVGHELLWHGYAGNVQQRQDRLMRLYSGDISDGGGWPEVEGIDYILWYQEADSNEIREKINDAIKQDYSWCEVYSTPTAKKVGFWRRRNVIHETR